MAAESRPGQDPNETGERQTVPALRGTGEAIERDRNLDDTELRPRGGHGRRRIFVIGGVVLAIIIAFLYWWHSRYYESTDDAQIDGRLTQISARIHGNVTQVNVEENQEVEKGQVLIEIDPRDAEAALRQGEANLATAKANYEAALANVPITARSTSSTLSSAGAGIQAALATISQSQKQLDAAQSQVLVAQAQDTKAQLDLKRFTPLVQRDVISRQKYDAVVAEAASARAQLSGAKASLQAAQAQVQVANSHLATARADYRAAGVGPQQVTAMRAKADAAAAQIQQAEAALATDRLNLSYTKIVAPAAGIVNRKTVQVGQNVSAGQTLMTLVPLTGLWITANFKETQLEHMRPGQLATIKVDAYGGRTYHAKVTQIGGATGSVLSLFPPENATGNYVKVVQRIPVRLDFTNPKKENKNHLLRPGMSVEPTVKVR